MTQETSGTTVKTYSYNIGGNRAGFALKVDGAQQFNTTYTYDALNRLLGTAEGTVTTSYGYDTNGNRSYVQYNNGLREEYLYNLANHLTTLTNKNSGGAILSQYAYTYSLDGNQLTKTDEEGKVTAYTYDGLGRLTGESESVAGSVSQTYAYTYDDNGNRASLTATGADEYATSYTYDANNRLLTEVKTPTAPAVTMNYSYDANGNQVSKAIEGVAGSETSRYNGFNQLVEMNTEGGASSYTYAPSGLRASKTVSGTRTDFVLDGDNVVLELVDSAVTARYIRGINLVRSEIGSNTSYYLYNGHGDVVQLADAVGAVTKEYDYDAFGNEKNLSPSDTNPFRYCGEYFDQETGRYYLRARYYDPVIARFTSEDHIQAAKRPAKFESVHILRE